MRKSTCRTAVAVVVIGSLTAMSTQPDFQEMFRKQALEPTSMTPDAFATFLRGEYDK